MNTVLKISAWVIIAHFFIGFRVFDGKWRITKDDPTVWVRLCESDYTIDENDIAEGDPLYGINGLTFDQVLTSIINDYNSVPTSFLKLAKYPTDTANPPAPTNGNSAFTLEKAAVRTLDICFKPTDASAGLSSAYAHSIFDGSDLVGCEITAKPDNLKKAHFLTHILTHEMGHCFGLMHPQESTKSVMSYFGEKKTRLQTDDYAGLTFKYPKEDSYAKETNTLGLQGCTPADP
jgi:hypothetical protein